MTHEQEERRNPHLKQDDPSDIDDDEDADVDHATAGCLGRRRRNG